MIKNPSERGGHNPRWAAVPEKIINNNNNNNNNNHPLCFEKINPLTPELNPNAQRCLSRFFNGDFNFYVAQYATSF
jgi:hypothetical protein